MNSANRFMSIIYLWLLFSLFFMNLAEASVIKSSEVYDLSINFRKNPTGTTETPRFSWKLISKQRNTTQKHYSIQVFASSDINSTPPIWESGKVRSSQSVLVPYKGQPLESGKIYYWRVKVWDNSGNESDWSTESAYWQTGLLNKTEWKAKWIEGENVVDSLNGPALYFRKGFNLSKKVKSATLYVSSHGIYKAYLNGEIVGNDWFTPGWTSYNKRLQYQMYDVTELLSPEKNVIGATVASGWYRTQISDKKELWGSKLALLMQLEIIFENGARQLIITDGSWKATDQGPIRFSELYDGEIYDSQMEMAGWSSPGYNDKSWNRVIEKKFGYDNLVSTENEPIRKKDIIMPKEVFRSPKGEWIVDFGQNMVGWVEVSLTGKAGTQVNVWHGEVLDKNGNFYNGNLRTANQKNTYILKGSENEVFQPTFTFQGFRYIKIEGFPGEPKAENFRGIVLHSDMPVTGSFECSNPLINQLQHNIVWSQKGNFLDVPMDCPQRDERLGWTGDAQLFSNTAIFNMNVYNFFSKWLKDLAADQSSTGSVPPTVPNIIEIYASGAGWADAATIIPWNLYLAYGDTTILREQYQSMKSYVDFLLSNSTDYLRNKSYQFGDWLFYSPVDDRGGKGAVIDKDLMAQCFFAHSTQLLVNATLVLDKQQDANYYNEQLVKIKQAFMNEFVSPSGRLSSNTQTAYSLALSFDMLPEDFRNQAVDRLVQNIREYNNHITTGIVGTNYIADVLTRFGKTDIAYELLLKESLPGWLYQVKKGATTIWERWDGILPNGSFQDSTMNSFNHYALGSIGNWMYTTIAGINNNPETPGFKNFIIKPVTGGNLTYVNASHDSNYGQIISSWEKKDKLFKHKVTVPPNSTAIVWLQTNDIEKITESGTTITALKEIEIVSSENNYTKVLIGSGDYSFEIRD